jgi:hypothetical protein
VLLGSVIQRQFFVSTKVGGVAYRGSALVKLWHEHLVTKRGRVLEVVEADVPDHMDLFRSASPAGCGPLVSQVVHQTMLPNPVIQAGDFSVELLGYLKVLLDGLAVNHSAVGLLPMSALLMVREACGRMVFANGSSYFPRPATSVTLNNRAPEVNKVLQSAVYADLDVRLKIVAFLHGLCDKVERDFGLAKVMPPPFEPIPYSYDPPYTGVALYFTESGEQGRYPRRYRHATGTEHAAAKAREQETAQCHKEFQKVHHRTGGVFRCGSMLLNVLNYTACD